MFGKTSHSAKVHALIMDEVKDVKSCLINFEGFLRASTTPETVDETLRVLAAGVAEAEAAADISLRKMIDSLAGGAYLPATRQEMIEIATSCDRVANKCEAIANMSVFERFRFPAQFNDDVMSILNITKEQFDILEGSISLLFSDFAAISKDHKVLDEIRKLESAVDRIEQKLYSTTFNMELDLAHKMQISKFIDNLADISDIIENLADKIQIMVITRKV